MKNIIIGVTGAGGFIASHFFYICAKKKIKTLGFVRSIHHTFSLGENYTPSEGYFLGDLKDYEATTKFISHCDRVLNLAGILGTAESLTNPRSSVEVNIIGALNVFEACKLYKIPLVQIGVGNWWMLNPYSITKTTAEKFALMYANEFDCQFNVVRGLNAFGEGQKEKPIRKVIPNFILKALRDENIPVYGGNQLMDFIYVDDLCEILLEVLLSEKRGQLYEAGTGKGLKVIDVAKKIIKYTNSKSKIVNLGKRPGEEKNCRVVAKNPYPFLYTDFDKALKKTIAWYKKNYL